MVTYAERQQELINRQAHDWGIHLDVSQVKDAKILLASTGGKKAAKLAIADLYQHALKRGIDHCMVPADIGAPVRVLLALVTVGILEDGTESSEAVVRRYRLSPKGIEMAIAAEQRTMK